LKQTAYFFISVMVDRFTSGQLIRAALPFAIRSDAIWRKRLWWLVIYGVSSSNHSYLLCKPITWQLVRSVWPLYADRFLHNWDLDRSTLVESTALQSLKCRLVQIYVWNIQHLS
jgi:hypothetical protein